MLKFAGPEAAPFLFCLSATYFFSGILGQMLYWLSGCSDVLKKPLKSFI